MNVSRWYALLVLSLVALSAPPAGRAATPDLPPWLPRYDLDVRVDISGSHVSVRQQVTWINRHDRPAEELVFNVYPRYRVPLKDYLLLGKTLELLRTPPSESVEPAGRHGDVTRVTLVGQSPPLARGQGDPLPAPRPVPPPAPQELPFAWRPDNQTALTIPLPQPVGRGEAVTVVVEYELRLPRRQGRWGQWPVDPRTGAVTERTVTTLSHWLPVLAVYGEGGWEPEPFIPWHQPFYAEAGIYKAKVTLPSDQEIACTAAVAARRELPDGRQEVEMVAVAARDFALLCSPRYRVFSEQVKLPDGRPVTIRVLAFAEHEWYARQLLRIGGEAIVNYSAWFGSYPYSQFTLAESFFGWNGNECGGLVMVDARVFEMPHLARDWVDYLISHEICHQWWYNAVGTNGYRETFMDEGVVVHFTHKLMDRKFGRNNKLLEWPPCAEKLPNIRREDYRHAGMYGTFRRGELGPTVGPLEGYGNLFNLFSAAYDKGGKVFGLIEQRLGSEAASLDFFRRLWCRYHFRILRAADLQRELEEYTGRPWGDFFAEWVYGRDLADWSVEAVQTSPASGGVRATVTVKQRGKVFEPTSVGFSLDKQAGYAVRVPLVPVEGRFEITDPPGSVERLDADTWRVDVLLPEKPSQVAVDPDQIVPDSHPRNNFWHTPIAVRPSPVYTLVDETDLFNRYDACNVIYGPWLFGPSYADPWYTRSTMLGLRAGIQKTQELYAGAFTAYRTEIRDIVAGADFLLDHTPFPYTQVGGNFERRLVGPFGADGPNNVNRASLFGRWVFQYGPSFYLPPIHYLEGFGVYQDNYLPYTRTPTPGAERPLRTTAGGLHYHLNLLTPYWDAETGVQFDATYSAGVAELARSQGFQQFQSQLSGAQKLPDGLGWLSHVKLAGRVSGAVASPQQGQFFALGGGTIFRGFDLAERQGNAYWAASAEARLPVLIDVRYDICDRLIGLRNLYVAPFYDAGEIYANGDSVGGVAHAVGVGLRAEVVVFSIMERAVLRLDAAKTVNAATPVQFWIGFSHPF